LRPKGEEGFLLGEPEHKQSFLHRIHHRHKWGNCWKAVRTYFIGKKGMDLSSKDLQKIKSD